MIARRSFLSFLAFLPVAARAQTAFLQAADPAADAWRYANEGTSSGITIGQFRSWNPPECDRPTECRFSDRGSTSTLMNCGSAVIDREGRIISTPGNCNTTTTQWECLTCGKTWASTQ